MRSKFIQIMLLLAMTFNIAHASIVANADHCNHESANEYILEQSDSTECGDICDLHHLFHLTAIIGTSVEYIPTTLYVEQPTSDHLAYHPSYKETSIKPPIA